MREVSPETGSGDTYVSKWSNASGMRVLKDVHSTMGTYRSTHLLEGEGKGFT